MPNSQQSHMYGWVGCAQVPPKARAALHVHEAQLALLLRLLRSALQASGAGSGSGYRLAAVDIINQLTRCQVRALLHLQSGPFGVV